MNAKTMLTLTVALGALTMASLTIAADDKAANPVGTWKLRYEVGEQKRTSTLTVKKEGEKLAGTLDWPDQKDEKVKDLQFKDGKLTFSAERKFMGNTIPIDYALTVDGDKLKGTGAAEFGGEKQEFEIEGDRDK